MSRFSRSGGAGSRRACAFALCSHRAVEALEARVLLSTFTVTNTNDSGVGSLRQAILSANSTVGVNTITFSIPGPGLHTIAPISPLPVITNMVTIDGTTQPGYSAVAGVPVIELSGANAGKGANGLVLGATTQGPSQATGSVAKALIINRFAGDGLVLQGPSDQVKGCYIGLNSNGTAAAPNGGNGIAIFGSGAMIGGSTTADRNAISGNALAGIDAPAPAVIITGNYIGTNAIGTAAVGNGHEGIWLLTSAMIGGDSASLRNIISGNGYSGINMPGPVNGEFFIDGNYIGTDATGTVALGNGTAPGAPFRDGITTTAGNVHIGQPGGAAAPRGNLISGNHGAGIDVLGGAGSTQIQSNLIGTDFSGNAALGNAGGVVAGGTAVLIGAIPATIPAGGSLRSYGGNVISGNQGDGVLALANSCSIQGNFIGTNLAGTAAVPNTANGVELQSASNFIGLDDQKGNVISGNGAHGILIDRPTTLVPVPSNNRIINNLIGTNASGTAAIANAGNGILITSGASNVIATVGLQQRQVISGNGAAGISLRESATQPTNNMINNNYIGTNLAGNAPLGNASNGVEDFDIGDILRTNLISANGASGVYIGQTASTFTGDVGDTLVGNDIGTNASGAVAAGLGNAGDGVTIFRSSNNSIAGVYNPPNIIAGNAGNGVTVDSGGIASPGSVQPAVAVRNRISQNSIFSNGGLGIDLGNDGVTPNRLPNQPLTGPNNLQPFPVILGAVSESTLTLVRYQLVAPASTVEFFANPSADPSGYGEGQTFFVSLNPGGGLGPFTVHLLRFPVGTVLSATATDAAGDTSEFSQDVATVAPPPTVTHSAFNPQNNTIAFTFSTDVSASLSPSAVRVHNETTGADVPATGLSYDPTTNTATFQLPGTLPSGTYVVTLLARQVSNSQGVELDGRGDGFPGSDYTFQFNVVSGDVNLDGAVSFADLLILASNYGQAGTFSQGDLNHDGTVDFADLLILAQGYGQGAASPA